MLAAAVCLLLECAVAHAKPWPTNYDAPSAKWVEGSAVGHFAYRSNSYLILSDQALGRGRVTEIAMVAESVRGVLRLFPLELLPDRPAHNRKGEPTRDVVRIYSTQKDYLAAGGPGGSVGFFNARTKEVMVSLEYLIEPKGPRSNLEPRQRYRLLVHELVHQAMGDLTFVLPLWFTEGLAEYISAIQFAPGRYRFDNNHRQIINHFRAVWLHDRRDTIAIPRVDQLSTLTARGWSADNLFNRENAYAKYATSLLLTHYQLELASRNLGGLREFLAEAKEKLETAKGYRSRYRPRMPSQAGLWKDRPPQTVQRQLATYWDAKGLNLKFTALPEFRQIPRSQPRH